MSQFLDTNPGLRSRFPRRIRFESYSPAELLRIAEKFAHDRDYHWSREARDELERALVELHAARDPHWGNAREMRNLTDYAVSAHASRYAATGSGDLSELTTDDACAAVREFRAERAGPNSRAELEPEAIGDLLAELDALIGLDGVKRQVRELIAMLEVQGERKRAGKEAQLGALHLRFEGPPGTGKTECARIVARIAHSLKLVSSGHLIEADREKLVGQYQGHTAAKTNALIDEALGGVLFIDEAYSLISSPQDAFGREAVSTLLKRMEDDRERLLVIAAGYEDEMERFIASNPGLRSRFPRRITFEAYSAPELLRILEKFASDSDYHWSRDAMAELHDGIYELHEARDRHWGNAREMRNLFGYAVAAHASRLHETSASDADLGELSIDDARVALQSFSEERQRPHQAISSQPAIANRLWDRAPLSHDRAA
jgi:SpoVK/Ycf46/Vps4 family AAA+-type ATPase